MNSAATRVRVRVVRLSPRPLFFSLEGLGMRLASAHVSLQLRHSKMAAGRVRRPITQENRQRQADGRLLLTNDLVCDFVCFGACICVVCYVVKKVIFS